MIPLSAKIKLSHEFTILKSSTFQRYLLFRNDTYLLFISKARVEFIKSSSNPYDEILITLDNSE